MKKFLALLLTLALVFSFAACQSSEPADTPGDEPQEEQTVYKIGIAAKNFSDAFTAWQAQLMYEKAGTDYDCFEVSIIDCEGSIEKELSTVETFISQGCDAILWQCSDSEAGVAIANQAHEAGVVLISLSNVVNDDYSYAIKSDQVQEGEIIGSFLADALPEGANVLICRAPDGSNYGNNRTKGVTNALLDVRSDVVLLEEKPADWDRAKAMNLMEDWLTAYDHIDAVICHNDQMALGCVDAIEAAGRLDEIMVFGIDGLPEACWSIEQGKLTGSVIQDAVTQSDRALALAFSLLSTGQPTDDVVDRVVVIDGELVCEANGNLDKWINVHKESGNWQYE